MFDLTKITGQIIIDNGVIGTGFLVNSKYFITARHNLLKPMESVKEKEVIINFKGYGEVKGKTINLIEAYEKDIDCVIVELTEEIFGINYTKVICAKNNLKDFNFNVYGYPKEQKNGMHIYGVISANQKDSNRNVDYTMCVKKEDALQSYKGLSGSPLIIDNLIVGIVIQQGTSDKLFGISFNIIRRLLSNIDEYCNIEEKELKRESKSTLSYAGDELSISIFEKHIDEAIRIAGPRYNEELNINTETSRSLLFFTRDNNNINELEEMILKLTEYIKRLEGCVNENSYGNVFSDEAREETMHVYKKLNDIVKNCGKITNDIYVEEKIEYFNKINSLINELKEKLDYIFQDELIKFEKINGKGTYNNKKWRGFMASYMCTFPCQNLDDIKEVKSYLEKLENFFKTNPVKLYFSSNILLKGKGGIGKTHCLCNLVNKNIKDGIPSLLFFGQEFREKSPEETMLEKLSIKGITFEYLLYRLNIIGEIENKVILICIDGINETDNKRYWNDNLIRLVEKIKKYRNVKLIVSCRSLYVSEVLENDVADRILFINHTGFRGVEYAALEKYFQYYNIGIPFENKMEQEYYNPLFLKLYCETLNDTKEEAIFDIDGLTDLLQRFLKARNDKISKKLSKYMSTRDKVVFLCAEKIAEYMNAKSVNFIEWKELRKIIKLVLTELLGESDGIVKQLLDELISENILKENDVNEETVSFSFERFYDYLIAENILKMHIGNELKLKVNELLNNIIIYKGVLEVIIILYREKYDNEIIYDLELQNAKLYKLTLTSLAWRKTEQVDYQTIKIIEHCLCYTDDQELIETSLFSILELSLKKKCIINAYYFNNLFMYKNIINRDNFLGYIMLKSYENHEIIGKIVKNAGNLNSRNLDMEIIKLWEIILGWFTSLNDRYLRDLSSKALTNIIRLYPETIFFVIDVFKKVNDEYIQERLWGAIYASLILNREKEDIKNVIEYIYKNFIFENNFPTNILIRDYLRNIAEFAKHLNLLDYNIEDFRPPYNSEKINKIKSKDIEKIKEEYSELYYNCTESDFGIYTISGEVEDYGFSKKDIGNLIFVEILDMGYSEKTKKLDEYIDYTYGSLRSRDESVERVGKKYQNIALYNILGRIYDNYIYKPKYKYDDYEEIIPKEQGNRFRKIDLTCILPENLNINFKGNEFTYDFDRIRNLKYMDWFRKEDLKNATKKLIEFRYEDEEYILLEGYFDSEDYEGRGERYPLREIWFQIRSYLVKNIELKKFKGWVEDKNFDGRWMPEGRNFYEGCIGEYPWSASYRNYLEQEYERKKVNGLQVKLIPTINQFNNEKDSPFCSTDIANKFLFPCNEFFKDIDLTWNGGNVYTYDSKKMFIMGMGKDRVIYVNRQLLNEYLDRNEFTLIWTTLGEKQIITGGIGNNFPGRAEISESCIYEEKKVVKSHYLYNIINGR
ncbi:serine protease [Clostridium sp.]|uniref:serine protease n=1 Tax=Clostridium sp. TaxID=1506 RepID=UPI002844B174|nr:serine protease [Clostridium sp.]MDR3595045.1 serine protease [Clostridium sp.]